MGTRKYSEAVRKYSKAIALAPWFDSSFYSNRALAFLKWKYNYQQALKDVSHARHMLQQKLQQQQQQYVEPLVEKLIKCYLVECKCLFELGKYNVVIDHGSSILLQLGYNPNHKSIDTFKYLIKESEERIKEFNLVTLNGTCRIDFVDKFRDCDELLEKIFSYLEPSDMLQCEMVCSDWKLVASDNIFWKRFCERRWENKQNISFQKVLAQSSSIADFSWKKRYYEAEHDAVRVKLTAEELSKINFCFYMYHMRNYPMGCKFFADFTFQSSFGVGMTWKFVDLGYKIQVEEYPPLTISRDKNSWAWVLTNDYVKMVSESYDN
jgi:tetratricopeptide (TPR) repeat protein